MMTIKKYLAPLLVAFMATGSVAAQDGTFNPENPPEPDMRFKVTVVADPPERAVVSGSGYYNSGQSVYINSSSRDSDWELKNWTINDEIVSTEAGFYYTVTDSDVELIAHYGLKTFNPSSPADPDMGILTRPLNLTAQPSEACSFNISSGTRYAEGSSVYVYCYVNQGFVFKGWYKDGQLLSTDRGYAYTMPDSATELTAIFTFDPDSPSEPEAVLVKGDVNIDFRVDSLDSAMTANTITNAAAYNNLFDINDDGKIDSLDISAIIKIIVSKKNS